MTEIATATPASPAFGGKSESHDVPGFGRRGSDGSVNSMELRQLRKELEDNSKEVSDTAVAVDAGLEPELHDDSAQDELDLSMTGKSGYGLSDSGAHYVDLLKN